MIEEGNFDEVSALAADGMVEKLSDGEGYLTIKFDDSAQFKAFNDNFAGDGYGSQILELMDQDAVATLTNTYQDVFDTILLRYQED